LLEDNQPKGAISLKFGNNTCEIEALTVDSPKQGYGSKLLRFAEELAKTKGCHSLWCYSLELYQAGDFYKKNGWVEYEFISNFWDNQNCFKYSKSV